MVILTILVRISVQYITLLYCTLIRIVNGLAIESVGFMKKIYLRINELLHEHNLSINELHLKTGIRRATLSDLANGKRIRIQFEHIEKIANALDIDDINEIITLIEDANERFDMIAEDKSNYPKK